MPRTTTFPNAIAGLSGSITVRFDLFGGSNGSNGTFRMDNFVLNGYTTALENWSPAGYRYGFNNKEKDDEVKGGGNSYDFGARMYDCRLSKFLSLDRLAGKYPGQSPYLFAGNTPIWAMDPQGDSVLFYSKSGEYLGYSNDNLRYKELNLLAIIDDKCVEAFKSQYAKKTVGRNDNDPKNDVYTEAITAGLVGMSNEVYDVNSFVSFFKLTNGKTLKDGKLVPISDKDKNNENFPEFSAPVVYKDLTFKRGNDDEVSYKLKVITVDVSKMIEGIKGYVVAAQSPDGLGKFHTHPGGLVCQYPTYTEDYVNGSKTSMNVVVSLTRFNLFKCSGITQYGVTNAVNISILLKDSNGKSKPFTAEANKKNGMVIK